eukprot:TRINITY_DN1660_c0_g1_i4.p1 TRINITY_DN1660_c0_g1~~TRINITY_DN1660_c0_g1_i4.p1  ORF type:complete len:112 (-),score=12.32 TRINITY_DN1660_c0_g1_i4:339-674(-)
MRKAKENNECTTNITKRRCTLILYDFEEQDRFFLLLQLHLFHLAGKEIQNGLPLLRINFVNSFHCMIGLIAQFVCKIVTCSCPLCFKVLELDFAFFTEMFDGRSSILTCLL